MIIGLLGRFKRGPVVGFVLRSYAEVGKIAILDEPRT